MFLRDKDITTCFPNKDENRIASKIILNGKKMSRFLVQRVRILEINTPS